MLLKVFSKRTGAELHAAPFPDMVWVPGGRFLMGSDRHYPEEAPQHPVELDGFWLDRFPVTNASFQRFVEATHWVTVAERPVDPSDCPGAPAAALVPGSLVFHKPPKRVSLDNWGHWWRYVPGACWKHPEGPASDLEGRGKHPVVHLAFEDVQAFATWAGKQLPTEAEWERAARGGLEDAEYAWGDELAPGGRHLANVWQGEFPHQNLRSDGYEGTSPVGAFPSNGYGLYDMIGNVWEWTADWYTDRHPAPAVKPAWVPQNPRGGDAQGSRDAGGPARKVIKGGSHLSAPNYCFRFRPAARLPQSLCSGSCHLGFRLALRP